MKLNRFAKLSIIAVFAVVFIAATAYTQTSRTFVVQVSNICSQQSVTVAQIILTVANTQSAVTANITLPPSNSINATFIINSSGSSIPDPSLVEVTGTFNGQSFSALFRGIVLGQAQTKTSVAGGCLQVLSREQ